MVEQLRLRGDLLRGQWSDLRHVSLQLHERTNTAALPLLPGYLRRRQSDAKAAAAQWNRAAALDARARPRGLKRRGVSGTSPPMTPGARLSAAIELLDAAIAGEPAERALTRWARASRFAGSKDRAAVRDLVYDGLRQRRSLGWLGGGDSGRAILLAHQAAEGADLDALFTGDGFDPGAADRGRARRASAATSPMAPEAVRLDYPDFLARRARGIARRRFRAGAGGDAGPRAGRSAGQYPEDQRRRRDRRARPRRRAGRAATRWRATRSGCSTTPAWSAPAAPIPRAWSSCRTSRARSSPRPPGARPGMTVLDYCAGGGGKTLALAAAMHGRGRLMAWDVNPRRMADLPERARRAGAEVRILADAECAALGRSATWFWPTPPARAAAPGGASPRASGG